MNLLSFFLSLPALIIKFQHSVALFLRFIGGYVWVGSVVRRKVLDLYHLFETKGLEYKIIVELYFDMQVFSDHVASSSLYNKMWNSLCQPRGADLYILKTRKSA